MPRPKKEAPNRKDKRYEVKRATGELDADGNPVRKSFYSLISKADAAKKADEWVLAHEIEKRTGEPAQDGTPFDGYALKWLNQDKKPTVTPRTFEGTYRIYAVSYTHLDVYKRQYAV